MRIDTIVSQWGETLDTRLRARLPGVDVISQPRGVPPSFPARPHAWFATPSRPKPPPDAPPPPGWLEGTQWVQLLTVGIDIYPRWMLDAPIVTTANGTASEVIAEFALACVLAAQLRLPERWIHAADQWQMSPALPLRGSVLGLLGYGGIGQALAPKALALGMRVLVLRRSAPAATAGGIESAASVADLFSRSDHLVLAAPGTPETRHIVNAQSLRHAKAGLHLVNVARGSLIDQDALLAALDDGRIGGASLDVTEPEPLPAGHRFYTHPRIRLSPHTSAISPAQQDALIDKAVRNLRHFEAGERLEDQVDADRIARGY